MLYCTLDHRIDGLVFTFIDIIETKKAKETLLIQNRYRRLFESDKDGILIPNKIGKIIDVYPFLIKRPGYSCSLCVKKTICKIGAVKDIVANKVNFQNYNIRNLDILKSAARNSLKQKDYCGVQQNSVFI